MGDMADYNIEEGMASDFDEGDDECYGCMHFFTFDCPDSCLFAKRADIPELEDECEF